MNKKYRKKSKFLFIKQTSMMECGTTSLAMIFRFYGLYNVKALLAQLGKVSTQGTNLYALSEIATQFGFESDGYKLDGFDHFEQITLPCIAHYQGNHFVVIYKLSKTHIWIADPSYGKEKLGLEDFKTKWNGIIMTMEPTPDVFQNPDVMDLVERYRERKKNLKRHFYYSLLKPFKAVIAEILVASLLLQLLGLALPFFAQGIIDKVLVYNDRKLLFAILIGLIIIFFSQVMLNYTRDLLLVKLKVRLELDFFSKFFNHFIHLTQTFFDMNKREDFIQRFQENLKIRRLMSPSILQAFVDLLFVFIYVVVLFFYNGALAGIALIFVVLFIGMIIRFTPVLNQMETKIFYENLKTMGSFLDTLLGIQTIKLLGIEKLKIWSWKNKYKKALNKVQSAEKMYIKLGTLLKAFYYLSHILVYWIGAYTAIEGKISIGQYVAFISIFTLAMNKLNNASSLWFMITELSVTFTRLNDVLIQDQEARDILNAHKQVEAETIEFKNVDFSYDAEVTKNVISNLSMKIKRGAHIGIVGRNGSGKSTLVKLLAGLYVDYQGHILIDGISLKDIYLPELRQKIYLFPQEIFLFDASIKENIQYGNLEANMEQIIEASKLADCHEFIKANYLGYNMRIGDNGINLSGGEKLKIGFARLFLANPEVIILDEASSALDVQTEKGIMNNLYTHFKDKTIITIAHRMNTLSTVDTIYVMDRGTIKEEGSHAKLMERKGLYHKYMQTYLDI
ncbi:MAG: peptidase domain-containing ABC transporter [Bacteroidota bacterium]